MKEFPLRVVPDWDVQKKRANTLCRLIDRHLDYEAGARSLRKIERLGPRDLGPGHRVQMVKDAAGVIQQLQQSPSKRVTGNHAGRHLLGREHP
jgi:hypothetical protein